jgi:RHS repeat-associated protein
MSYVYTNNKLSSITTGSGTIELTWDANGNLLDDESYAYGYDHANRLKTVSGQEVSTSNVYNGLGVRVQETAGGTTTHYVVDLNAGLSQVLSDGTSTYLYGVDRIAQQNTGGMQYFLGDALGSVRQLTDAEGELILARDYEPYGVMLNRGGSGTTSYGFAGEWTDGYIGLVNLRSRMYPPSQGRFISKDLWPGDYSRPMSLNGWNYVEGNPIIFIDPSGHIKEGNEAVIAKNIIEDLHKRYAFDIRIDFKYVTIQVPDQVVNANARIVTWKCVQAWYGGAWDELHQLELVKEAIEDMGTVMGGEAKFKSASQGRP